MAKRQGTVKWFNQTKGFGFIACDDGTEAFVHYSAIEGQKGFRSLKQGDRVELEISQSPKGPRAEKVRLLKSNDWL
ncbi:cold shock protein (beta-ribbon, CspA family) [Candidatus Fervidibacteria bacterium JGI MDM2 JNZ-1-D12]